MQYVDAVKVQINCKVLLVLDKSTYNKSINEKNNIILQNQLS